MSQRRGRQRRQLSRLYLVLGALTIAVFAILGYVSFTANSGLPLASSYTLIVSVPNAERVTKSDEVRIDGVRVGQVQQIAAVAPAHRTPYARLTLALSRASARCRPTRASRSGRRRSSVTPTSTSSAARAA